MIGGRIKNIRISKSLTQQVFAAKLGTYSGFISEVENGIKLPGFDLISSLKREFPDVNMNWLLSGEDDPRQERQMNTRDALPIYQPPSQDPQIRKLINLVADLDEQGKKEVEHVAKKEKERVETKRELERLKGFTEKPKSLGAEAKSNRGKTVEQ